MLSNLTSAYRGKRVFVTGHTGFKGSWLCEWLLSLGAEVVGYALDPQPHEILFDQLKLSERLVADHRGDLCDRERLVKIISDFQPEIVLHLAAQPLVRLSYDIPVETFATNVMGTAHVLDAVRLAGISCRIVAVTTDKCYENREWLHAYREEDPMGGHDPYSASKGAAEIVIASYRSSFFPGNGAVKLASARAGNVIGGGDWALDRIIPDCIRALRKNEAIPVRNKIATRPWQHVLEPLSGYLWLAASLATPAEPGRELTSAFNFGPNLTSNRTVSELVEELLRHVDGGWIDASDPNARHEASKLNLATDKAFHLLQWQPVWNFEQTIAQTADWYQAEANGADPAEFTRKQISEYQSAAAKKALVWALPANNP
ncbi:CDP-glucose 4,6-dehydratase [Luteolibacter pohnpeiensis]|uniref:CDP-glucose 4,6-dehydratase n=1 Tax=Luteolibacter pohnpeiensis TaxID=454153 RepID=A0A934VW58_9BACT|nr:CDP-glucose 4,6-dehydratase [Luteolibacter pohnpeiensis]MBK1882473.1 CDP-glucose 4,6-dehydratase [Luteolibacter pohnpeiensis]